MWKKTGEIRREVLMVIAPSYANFVRENRNGWTKADMMMETKLRYFKNARR